MAPPAPRECNQPARSALHRIPCSAGMNQPAAQRIASQTIRAPCKAPPAPITSPPRIARRARHTPRTCSSAHALRSTLRSFIWFVVLTFTKFNLYTSRIATSLCVRSSVGSQPRSLPSVPGSIPGESFRLFSSSFYFRHFHHS